LLWSDSPPSPRPLGHTGQFLHPRLDSGDPMPEGNKSRVSGVGVGPNHTKYSGWQFWWPWAGAGYLFRDLDPLLKFH